ncbi:MAG: class I SAM-dependent methyltransferase [Cyclobacteriaceae bacterium]
MMERQTEKFRCYLCGSTDQQVIAVVNQRPDGETDYAIPPENYHRVISQCMHCSVYNNQHQLLDEEMYHGDYNASIRQTTSLGSIQQRYEKVMNLPEGKSDNRQRVSRIAEYFSQTGRSLLDADVLDVGSGTCVFLGALKDQVSHSACIDPDPLAVKHAKQYVGIDVAHHGTLKDFPLDHLFDLITFNKVLEHVKAPVEMLTQAARLIKDSGLIYVELPEGARTVKAGNAANRQEFFVEHYTVYNQPSFLLLCEKAGFKCLHTETITESSGKMTIYGFLTRK